MQSWGACLIALMVCFDGYFLLYWSCLPIMRNSVLNSYNPCFSSVYLIIWTKIPSSRCVMALIRGINSHYPCPVCLVPSEDLSDLSKIYPLRTTEKMKEIYDTAQEADTIAEREVILKEYGLRNVEVGWPWAMQTSQNLICFLIGRIDSVAERFLEAQQYWCLCSCILGSLTCVSWWPVLRSSLGSFQRNCHSFREIFLWEIRHSVMFSLYPVFPSH